MGSIFRSETPQPPQPTDKPDIEREGNALRALAEVKRVVDSLIKALNPFQPTRITSVDGKVFRALAQQIGSNPEVVEATPFEPLDPHQSHPGAVYIRIYLFSFLRKRATSTGTIQIDGLDEDFQINAGDDVWVQIDTSDGLNATAASIEHGQHPPYEQDGELIKLAEASSTSYIWDESFFPIARVFASDGKTPLHGGKIFSAGGIHLEVKQLLAEHLSMVTVLNFNGAWAMRAAPDSGYVS